MKITIEVDITSEAVTGSCNLLQDAIKSNDLDKCIESINDAIQRHFHEQIRTGKISNKDPEMIRLFVGNDSSFQLETALQEIDHEIYMGKIESLMQQYYPSLLSEKMWHMLVPKHRLEYDDDFREEADKQETEAYNDLESNGTTGLKWQAFLKEYMDDPSQNNKHFLIKHGLVKASMHDPRSRWY